MLRPGKDMIWEVAVLAMAALLIAKFIFEML